MGERRGMLVLLGGQIRQSRTAHSNHVSRTKETKNDVAPRIPRVAKRGVRDMTILDIAMTVTLFSVSLFTLVAIGVIIYVVKNNK